MKKISIKCPCCGTVLSVDADTGLVLGSKKPAPEYSFEEALKREEEKSSQADELFARAVENEKNRAGRLEQKFKSIMDSKDELDEPAPRSIDLD